MTLFGSLVLAAAVAAPLQTFTPYKRFENLEINIDTSSFAMFQGDGAVPLVGLTIQLVMSPPITYDGSKPIKSYVNTLVVDCNTDTTMVIAADGFGTSGEAVFSKRDTVTMKNSKIPGTPVFEIMEFVCKPLLLRYKEQSQQNPVTKIPGLET